MDMLTKQPGTGSRGETDDAWKYLAKHFQGKDTERLHDMRIAYYCSAQYHLGLLKQFGERNIRTPADKAALVRFIARIEDTQVQPVIDAYLATYQKVQAKSERKWWHWRRS